MRFILEFGDREKFRLEFSFNQLLGTSTIRVNDEVVEQKTRWFSEPLKQTHEVRVGKKDSWCVTIVKERKLLFGQKCRVFLNQRLAGCYDGV